MARAEVAKSQRGGREHAFKTGPRLTTPRDVQSGLRAEAAPSAPREDGRDARAPSDRARHPRACMILINALLTLLQYVVQLSAAGHTR